MNQLTIEHMESIEGGSEAGYAVGRAIGAFIAALLDFSGDAQAYNCHAYYK